MKTTLFAILALMTGCAARVAPIETTESSAQSVCEMPTDVVSCYAGRTRYHVDATSHAAVDADSTTCQMVGGSLFILRADGETIHLSAPPADRGYRTELCYAAPVSR